MEADPLRPTVPQIGPEPLGVESLCLSPPISSFHPRLVGAGLWNLGNTCFLNAVLQCLTHTVPLVQKIRDAKHSCPSSDDNAESFCSFCALKEHINHCLISSGSVISPECFAKNLSKISSCFELGQQEDAHEFLHSLLDSVHTSSLSLSTKDKPASLDEDSIVKEVFGGRLRSQLRCCDCGHCSDTYEPLLDLSLEIDDVDSITAALESFTKLERIEDPEIKFNCEGCKAQVSMEKQLKLDRAPQVVALHLKRFKNNGFFSSKIYDHVKYPLELDLKPFLSCPQDEVDMKYDLYAVVVHIGSFYSGHYYSIIRSSPTTWHQMDDSKISKFSENDVLDQTAYILFYIKQGSACWFSSIMEAEKVPHEDIISDTSPVSVLDHAERDCGLCSVGETSCSSSGGTTERAEHVSLCNIGSSTEPTSHASLNEAERSHAGPPRPSNYSNDDMTDKVGADRFLTQHILRSSHENEANESMDSRLPAQETRQPILKQQVFDMFDDETFDDEKENDLIPDVQAVLRGRMEVQKPDPEVTKNVRRNEPFHRLVRSMPKSRRNSLLHCIDSQQSSHKQPYTVSSLSVGNKRQRINLATKFLGAKGSPQYGPRTQQSSSKYQQSLSPRSLRRSLFL